MLTFIAAQRLRLWDEFPPIFRIVIRPAINFRNFPGPVAMSGPDRRRPLQRGRTPGVPGHHPSTLKDRIEEVEDERRLGEEQQRSVGSW